MGEVVSTEFQSEIIKINKKELNENKLIKKKKKERNKSDLKAKHQSCVFEPGMNKNDNNLIRRIKKNINSINAKDDVNVRKFSSRNLGIFKVLKLKKKSKKKDSEPGKITTKYEKIITILQDLESKAKQKKDEQTAKDLNFCLKTLQENDLHVPLENLSNINDKVKLDVLNVYSSLLKTFRISCDAEIVAKKIEETEKQKKEYLLNSEKKSRKYSNIYKKTKSEEITSSKLKNNLITLLDGNEANKNNPINKDNKNNEKNKINEQEDSINNKINHKELKSNKRLTETKEDFNFNIINLDTNALSPTKIKTNITISPKISPTKEWIEKYKNYVPSENMKSLLQIIPVIQSPEFSIFALDKVAGKSSIYLVLSQGFLIFNLYDCIVESKFLNFCNELMKGYDRNVKYHNDLHGADVCQTTLVILKTGLLKQKLALGNIDLIAILTAAAAHDFKHPGLNNNFHVNKGNDLALTYNDATVLENFHVSQTYKCLLQDKNNFMEKFSQFEFRHIRRRMIDGILSTDMARHAEKKNQLNVLISTYKIKEGKELNKIIETEDALTKFNNQQLLLSQVIHTSDLSNPAKLTQVYNKWTEVLYQEFFAQGDLEKELKMQVSPLCDRETVKIPDAQVGFIKFVVLPQFELMKIVIPEIDIYIGNIKNNLKNEEERVEQNKIKETAIEDLKNNINNKNKENIRLGSDKNLSTIKKIEEENDGSNDNDNGNDNCDKDNPSIKDLEISKMLLKEKENFNCKSDKSIESLKNDKKSN